MARFHMQIKLKLFATLGDYLPPGSRGNQVQLDIPEDDSVLAVLSRLRLPSRLTHLVLVNGVYIAPDARATRRLSPGDQLAVWPPIAGG
jgi:sulfur carrier protein ThiS